MSYLRLATNIPVETCLKFDSGKTVESQIDGSKQMMFTLSDDDKLYVPLSVASRMEELGIRKGVPFRIGKREVPGPGAKKRIEWFVERLSPAPEPDAPAERPEPFRAGSTVTVRPAAAAPAPAPAAATPIAPPDTASANLMAAALMAAVDSAILAEKYASAKNFPLKFDSEDIRSMAATIYIQAAKGQVTTWRQ